MLVADTGWDQITNPDQLTSSYDAFVAQPIVPYQQNLIYVRGAATDPTRAASADIVIGSGRLLATLLVCCVQLTGIL
jgi:hypothetical protein